MDWLVTFYPTLQHLDNPYLVRSFINPPWLVLLLLPFRYVSLVHGLILNGILTYVLVIITVRKRRGDLATTILVLTSVPMLQALFWGTVEWIGVLAFLVGNVWALPLLIIKPQTGIFAGIAWFKKSRNKLTVLLPLSVLPLSLLIWPSWPVEMLGNIQHMNEHGMTTWNWSPFPLLVPLGILMMIYLVFDKYVDGELMGVLATLCLAPYFNLHTLLVPYMLIALASKKAATYLWIAMWIMVIVRNP